MQAIWIEIPVADRERAQQFYAAVFAEQPAEVENTDAHPITVFEGTPTVSLNQADGFTATGDGSLPYFHVDDLDVALAAVSANAGRIIESPRPRGENGVFALVHDSEGNGLYLHGAG